MVAVVEMVLASRRSTRSSRRSPCFDISAGITSIIIAVPARYLYKLLRSMLLPAVFEEPVPLNTIMLLLFVLCMRI